MSLLQRFRGRRPQPVMISVHLNARVQPMHRGEIYEDPLDEILESVAPGSRVSGGGTAFSPDTGVESCDIQVDVVGDPTQVAGQVVFALESLGAPRGSWLTIGDGERVEFGALYGFALELDGTSLPAEVYAENDVNDLIQAVSEEIGGAGALMSWWEGPEWTSLFFYGHEPALIRAVLERAATDFALARGSRVTSITP